MHLAWGLVVVALVVAALSGGRRALGAPDETARTWFLLIGVSLLVGFALPLVGFLLLPMVGFGFLATALVAGAVIDAAAFAQPRDGDGPPQSAPPATSVPCVGQGEVGRAAVHPAAHHDTADRLAATLRANLPAWPVRDVLIELAMEIRELERGVAIARAAGLPEAVTDGYAREAETARDLLDRTAERLITTAAIGVESPALRDGLAREAASLAGLRDAVRSARAGLAELALATGRASDDLARAERRFGVLAEMARELRELE